MLPTGPHSFLSLLAHFVATLSWSRKSTIRLGFTLFSYFLSRSSRERHKGPSAFPTLKQAYAQSPSLRRASESYPLSPTLCLTRTDFPPCPAQLRAGRDPRPAGASAWPFHVSTSSTDFRVADSERSEGGRLPRRAREQQPHSGRPSAGAGGGGLLAAGTLNTWMFSSKPPHSGPAPLRTPLAGVAVVAMSLEAFRR